MVNVKNWKDILGKFLRVIAQKLDGNSAYSVLVPNPNNPHDGHHQAHTGGSHAAH